VYDFETEKRKTVCASPFRVASANTNRSQHTRIGSVLARGLSRTSDSVTYIDRGNSVRVLFQHTIREHTHPSSVALTAGTDDDNYYRRRTGLNVPCVTCVCMCVCACVWNGIPFRRRHTSETAPCREHARACVWGERRRGHMSPATALVRWRSCRSPSTNSLLCVYVLRVHCSPCYLIFKRKTLVFVSSSLSAGNNRRNPTEIHRAQHTRQLTCVPKAELMKTNTTTTDDCYNIY